MNENKNKSIGTGIQNGEAFINAVINRYFRHAYGCVDREDMFHEGRVALFETDIKFVDQEHENTSPYWWAVVRAIGAMLWEDYKIPSIVTPKKRKNPLYRPFSLESAPPDSPEVVAIYREKQLREADPLTIVETADWVEHWLGIAEGVLLDNDSSEQGVRDFQLFMLWLQNYSYEEILEHPDNPGYKNINAIKNRLRFCVEKLREFAGTDTSLPIVTGTDRILRNPQKRKRSGKSQAERFKDWYSDPENRERQRAKARERMRKKRAEAKRAGEKY